VKNDDAKTLPRSLTPGPLVAVRWHRRFRKDAGQEELLELGTTAPPQISKVPPGP
jgi:hypothetical protein